jgi:hypothetical protein
VAQKVGKGIALLFQDLGTRRRWVVSSTTRPYFTPGKDPVTTVLLYSGYRKISPPPGSDPRAVQPVVRHYTDWATRPNMQEENSLLLLNHEYCKYTSSWTLIRYNNQQNTTHTFHWTAWTCHSWLLMASSGKIWTT